MSWKYSGSGIADGSEGHPVGEPVSPAQMVLDAERMALRLCAVDLDERISALRQLKATNKVMHSLVRAYLDSWEDEYRRNVMEKHGVCEGEGDEKSGGANISKQMDEAVKLAEANKCCGASKTCGTDTASKAAEVAATPPKK